MSDMEFNTSVEEVVGMVSRAHQGKPRPWGIIVPGEQVQGLLELEANRDKLAREVEVSKRRIARMENSQQQKALVRKRAELLPRVLGTGVRLLFPLAFLLGASEGLMDPLFAWTLGAPCILWAVCHWMG